MIYGRWKGWIHKPSWDLLPFKVRDTHPPAPALPLLSLVICSYSHPAHQLDKLTNAAKTQLLARLVFGARWAWWHLERIKQQVDTPSNTFHSEKKKKMLKIEALASWCFAELHKQGEVCKNSQNQEKRNSKSPKQLTAFLHCICIKDNYRNLQTGNKTCCSVQTTLRLFLFQGTATKRFSSVPE